MTREILLTHGLVALVDDEDYTKLIELGRWFPSPSGNSVYARANTWVNRKNGTVLMHRIVTGASRGQVVDHANGNGLDNRRSNLRLCSRGQNEANSPNRTGRFKGVSRYRDGRWTAMIKVGGVAKWLGYYVDEEDAARAYDKAALNAWGEFAYLNLR